MRRKLRERMGSRSGFTLAETLMTVLILLMVTAVVAAGLPAAANAFDKVITGANAQLLLSTAATRLREELGSATKISVSVAEEGETKPTVIKYTNADGMRAQIYLSYTVNADTGEKTDRGIFLKQYKYDTENESELRSEPTFLVSKAASNKDRQNSEKSLCIKYDKVEYDKNKGIVTFTNLRVINEKNMDAGITGLDTFVVKVIALS